MKDIKRLLEIIFLWFKITCAYFYQGIKNKRLVSYSKNYLKEFFLHLEIFAKFIEEYKNFSDSQSNKDLRLVESSRGLHSLLNGSKEFYYSLIIVFDDSSLSAMKATLESALNVSAPNFEVLVGTRTNSSFDSVIKLYQERFPDKLKLWNFEAVKSWTSVVNALAEKSQGNYLFVLPQGDWIRPDIFYRYEQTLNFFSNKEDIVLFSDEYEVDPHYTPIPRTRTNKPLQPIIHYQFTDMLGNALLISKKMWKEIQGLDERCEEIHAFDLPLRLDLAGAIFQKVPLHLYAVLKSNKKKKEQQYSDPEISKRILEAYHRYALNKGLEWGWEKGYTPNTVRAIPILKNAPRVHVILLYKDQAEMTYSAIKHIFNQKGVHVRVTAVDNRSQDRQISETLKQWGVEVFRIDEPFNYSRLNNQAVQQSSLGKDCENLLFLNNDVDLEPEALLEMCRWIEQPGIGLVGCRLNYPNGLLQHGGVVIKSSRAAFIKSWHHQERLLPFNALKKTNYLRITPAVTAASCLIKRKIFLEVGGFDEMWFPVAFSDTALAVKVRARGLHCLYTPYAVGIHHESISRKKANIEDYESLSWTHRQFVRALWNNKPMHFDDLTNVEY